jgi:hypothetical protein
MTRAERGTNAHPNRRPLPVKEFAEFFGRSVSTVQKWLVIHSVPVSQPGDEAIIDAEEFWKAIPVVRRVKGRRGGDRHSREFRERRAA